jgi:hypothetical protein
MLHQLRARADQRERSVLLVEPFHSRIIEMRELQLDDIAIPCLALLFFFDPAHCHAGRNSSARSESARLSFWSHRSDAATRDRIELSFAAVHESLVGAKRTCRLHCAMSALRGKAENICSH